MSSQSRIMPERLEADLREWVRRIDAIVVERVQGHPFVRAATGDARDEIVLGALHETHSVEPTLAAIEANLLALAPAAQQLAGVKMTEVAEALGISAQAVTNAVGYKRLYSTMETVVFGRPHTDDDVQTRPVNVRRRTSLKQADVPADRLVDAPQAALRIEQIARVEALMGPLGEMLIAGDSPAERRVTYIAALESQAWLWSLRAQVEDRLLAIATVARIPLRELGAATGLSRQALAKRRGAAPR